ncbi:MAG TPA: hypothetical protein VGJ88_09340 [Thermoanaerobaculia bacterium]|jgi:hypothetical protein
MDISEFTYETIRPLVGTTFQLATADGRSLDLELVEVVKIMDQHVDARFKRDPFSLHFRGPQQPYMPQSTYAMSHETLGGPHSIFIVPISSGKDGFMYEAVFN